MKRRHVLKGIAAGSALNIGIGGASANPGARRVDVEQFDRLLVKDGNRVVDTVENPTVETARDAEASLSDDQRLVTPNDDCYAFCESNCPCYPCAVGCFDCCNPEENICDCCSEVDDPDNTECCEGC
jgi:hypothetical protein